jgi:hypothetical protein
MVCVTRGMIAENRRKTRHSVSLRKVAAQPNVYRSFLQYPVEMR